MVKHVFFKTGIVLVLTVSAYNVSEIRENRSIAREQAATLVGSNENDSALYNALWRRYGVSQSTIDRNTAFYVVNAALCGNYYKEMTEYAERLRKAGINEHKIILWHEDERISERIKLMAAGYLDLEVVAMTDLDLGRFREMLPLRSIMLVPGKERGAISHVWLQSSAIDNGLRRAVLKQVK